MQGTLSLSKLVCCLLFAGMGMLAAAEPVQADFEDEPPISIGGGAVEYGESLEPQHIVVTATRIPTPEGQVANSLSVFTAEQMEARQYRTVDEVLRYTPGIEVNRSGGLGSQTEVRMRGMDSGRTVVLLDGMPLNDPSTPGGGFDFSGITLDNIGQLEVLRGPQSALYGSNASGGVINLTSKRGEGPFGGFLTTEAGSRGTMMTRLGSSAGTDKVDYSFSGSLLHTDGISSYSKWRGYDEKDKYDQGTFALRLGANAGDMLRFEVFTHAHKSTKDLDMYDDWGNPYEYGIRSKLERYMIRPKITLSLLDGRWEQSVAYGYVKTERKQEHPFAGAMNRNKYVGETYKFDYQSIFHIHETNTLLAGVDVVTEQMKYEDPYYGPAVAPVSDFKSDKMTTVGLYLEDQINICDTFFATMGVRQEHNDDFGDKTTWKASAMYVLPTDTKLKASAGTGFKTPDLYRLFIPVDGGWGSITHPNPDLKPETSFGWDAGFEQSFCEERLQFGATYFRNKVKNKILQVAVDPMNPWGDQTYINAGRYRSWGIEAFVSFAVTECLTLSADYTWTRTEDARKRSEMGIQHRRPLNEVNVNADWTFLGKGTVTAGIRYVGKRWDIRNDFPYGNVRMPSYTVARLGASWKFNDHIEVFGRVENLLNKKYEEINGFGAERIGFFAGATLSF